MEIWPALLKHAEGKLSYQEGVALFVFLNPASPLADFFSVEDRYSRKRLKAILDEKYEELRVNSEANKFKSFAVSKNANSKINLEVLPEELRQEYAQQSVRIREISYLHSQLRFCSTDADRLLVVRKIVTLSDARQLCFNRIDQYMASGTDLMKPISSEVFKAKPELKKNYEIEYKIKLLRTQKTKLKKNPRRLIEYNDVCKQLADLISKRYDI